MSSTLVALIIAFCPGHDTDHKGQVITTACQERMVNCMINKVGTGEPTKKEFNECRRELITKYGSSDKVVASELLEK